MDLVVGFTKRGLHRFDDIRRDHCSGELDGSAALGSGAGVDVADNHLVAWRHVGGNAFEFVQPVHVLVQEDVDFFGLGNTLLGFVRFGGQLVGGGFSGRDLLVQRTQLQHDQSADQNHCRDRATDHASSFDMVRFVFGALAWIQEIDQALW